MILRVELRGDPRQIRGISGLEGVLRGLFGHLNQLRFRVERGKLGHQYRPELKFCRGANPLKCGLIGFSRNGDHDVLATLGGDFCLSNTTRVDALTDNRHRLSELLFADALTFSEPRFQNDLSTALEVERELRGPGALVVDD